MKKQIFKSLWLVLIITAITIFFKTPSNAQCDQWLWAKSAGGTGDDNSYSVTVDISNNVYITGMFSSSSITFGTNTITNPNFPNSFGYNVKYDQNGNVLWADDFGGWNITTDGSGNVYVVGNFWGNFTFASSTISSSGILDMLLYKYDINGNEIWAKKAGINGSTLGHVVVTDISNNVYVTGTFDGSSITFGSNTLINNSSGTSDIFLAKYDPNGNVLWAKSVGGNYEDGLYSLNLTSDLSNNIYLTGYYRSDSVVLGTYTLKNNSDSAKADIFIAKYDANGNVFWAKNLGSNYSEYPGGIATDGSGNIYLSGDFRSDTMIFDSDTLTKIDTNVISDMFIVKYDPNGNELWVKGAKASYFALGQSITCDASNNVYVTGVFDSSTVSFDIFTLNNDSNYNSVFIVKYDANGNVIWAKCTQDESYVFQYGSIATDGLNNLYMTGDFMGNSITFESTTLINNGNEDMFIVKFPVKLALTTMGINGTNISCYGNSDGAADLVIAGGTTPYTFLWSTGEITEDITGLSQGDYSVTVTDSFSCTATDSVDIIEPLSIQVSSAITICDNDSIFLQGAYQNSAGTYYDTLATLNGCDSVIATMLTVNPTYNTPVTVAICAGDSIHLQGSYQSTAGTYYDTLTTVNSCDSVITTTLIINPTYNTSIEVVICSGDSILLQGSYQTIAGTYYDTFATVNVCDSVITTTLTVNPVYSIADAPIAICDNDSALIYGTYRKTVATYYDSLNTVNGCDSIHSTVLSVNPTYNTTVAAAICASDSILLQGSYQTTAGTYYDTLATINGCDSVIATTLTINNSSSSSQTETACENYVWNGNTYTVSGTYIDTIPNYVGCDSLMTLYLTINNSNSSTQTEIACESYSWNSAIYTVSGAYIDTIPNAAGCDSIMTLNLTINSLPVVTLTLNPDTVCNDASAYPLSGGFPIGGSYSGNGVNGGNFNPATVVPGLQTITYTYTDNCTDSETAQIFVEVCTGISYNGSKEFSIVVVPNPNNGKFRLYAEQTLTGKIIIYNAVGSIVYERAIHNTDIDLSNKPAGIYFIKLVSNDRVIYKQKIIRE